ncbi:MAG TPA: M1 family aminopeptidase [Gemmatimonadaceae bacterium]|nr:M1 family aminopeptidase [Gemmatimonadaceae bacterium]
MRIRRKARLGIERSWSLRILCSGFVAASVAGAQTPSNAASPESLATFVMQKFSSGTAEDFAAVYPDSAGRVFMREARGTRQAELAQVVWKGPHRAVLLLGGIVKSAQASGRNAAVGSNETNGARHFSGFYEAVDTAGVWRVTRQIPLDSTNFVRAQNLHVDLTPATGIQVVDSLTITIGTAYGFGMRLNNAAQLRDVSVDGRQVEHAFGGGLLWLKAPKKARSLVVLSYSIEATRPSRAASDSGAAATPAFGAFNNTDVWHPFFDYLSPNDLAQITATVRIPAEYYLTTTVPQTDTVRDGFRTVYARAMHPEFLLALIYDRDWQPKTTEFGGFRFESFTGPGFRHSHDSLAAVTKRVYDLLAPRFGEPQYPSRYLAAVQARALGSGGFTVRMNNAAISGGGGGSLGSHASQTFAHETGHAWTLNATGYASNFLHEAWATFVEGLMLRSLFGHDDEHAFWDAMRNSYMVGNDRAGFAGGFEGMQSILANYDNGRIHYRKGVWILYSGNYVMGDSAFNRGMRLYIDGMGKGPSGYQELIAAWSKAAGHSMKSFVMPWLTSKYIPNVEARVDGDRLIVTQQQPGELFDLPKLDVDLSTSTGVVRKTLHLSHRADTLKLSGVATVSDIHVDPDHRFLLQRHWGEPVVRFELPVAQVPDAQSVQLNGNFLRAPMPAAKSGDAWVVELPMTEGTYIWLWQPLDAAGRATTTTPDSVLTGTRVVKPLQRITNAYPGR